MRPAAKSLAGFCYACKRSLKLFSPVIRLPVEAYCASSDVHEILVRDPDADVWTAYSLSFTDYPIVLGAGRESVLVRTRCLDAREKAILTFRSILQAQISSQSAYLVFIGLTTIVHLCLFCFECSAGKYSLFVSSE
jgi:hypothetical protein